MIMIKSTYSSNQTVIFKRNCYLNTQKIAPDSALVQKTFALKRAPFLSRASYNTTIT